jgi:hypothetical protein
MACNSDEVAEVDRDKPRAARTASCPNCGTPQVVDADKIISVAEDVTPLFDAKEDRLSSWQ